MTEVTCFVLRRQPALDQQWCWSASRVGGGRAGFRGSPGHRHDCNEDDGDDKAPLQDQEQASAEHIHCQRGNSASKPSSVGPWERWQVGAGCSCHCGGGSWMGRLGKGTADAVAVAGGEVDRCC